MLTRSPCRLLLTGILASGLVLAVTHAQTPPAALAVPAPVNKFQRLLIADTVEKVAALQAAPDAPVVVTKDLPLFDTPEFTAIVTRYLGQPISNELVNKLAKDVGVYVRQHDRVTINVAIPPQNGPAGELRLVFQLGRYKQLRFQGNRWFSREMLEAKLGVKPGDEIRVSTLEEAVNWTNTNPFRRVQLLINNLPEPGQADLIVNVLERIPVRVAASYDNTGSKILGENHYSLAVQFGNLWGLDHQGSYQFTTTEKSHVYQTHSLDYRIPLPWRHYVQISGAYANVRPSLLDGLLNQAGRNLVADLRYIIPVEHAPYSLEFSGGIDYKQVSNTLEFSGIQALKTKPDIFQITLGATAVRKDKLGAWAVSVNISASPGGFNSRNTDTAFEAPEYSSTGAVIFYNGRIGARARYLQGSLAVQRLTNLPAKFQLVSRGQLQRASTNLIGSEQMAIGGQGTVRGYDERIFAGDQGCLLSQELQGPVWTKTLPHLPKTKSSSQTRLIAFVDYAKVSNKHGKGEPGLDALMGAGLGVRCSISTNFNLSADYGWQLLKTTPRQPDHGRGHIQATLAF